MVAEEQHGRQELGRALTGSAHGVLIQLAEFPDKA